MSRIPSISIFFPFLNDWGTVGSLVALAIETAKKYTDDWEVIIVDDGSTKENREALEMIAGQFNVRNQKAIKTPRGWPADKDSPVVEGSGRIRVIRHEKNKGYGGALRSGFEAATKDLVFYTDCDAQYDPREMVLLIEKMLSHSAPPSPRLRQAGKASRDGSFRTGMVNGYKIKRNDPWFRIVTGRVYHHLVKMAFRLPIRDTDCDFRLIRREVFDKVTLYENTGTICVELVKKIDHFGYRITEVPVHHFWRTSGKSQFFNFSRLFKTGINLGRLWWKLMVEKRYVD